MSFSFWCHQDHNHKEAKITNFAKKYMICCNMSHIDVGVVNFWMLQCLTIPTKIHLIHKLLTQSYNLCEIKIHLLTWLMSTNKKLIAKKLSTWWCNSMKWYWQGKIRIKICSQDPLQKLTTWKFFSILSNICSNN